MGSFLSKWHFSNRELSFSLVFKIFSQISFLCSWKRAYIYVGMNMYGFIFLIKLILISVHIDMCLHIFREKERMYVCVCLWRESWFCLVLHTSVSSVPWSCLTLCEPMDWTIPRLPVHHQLPEFTQTHVHWVDDAIQPSHPLSSPSPPTFNLSQHPGLFKWARSCIRWPKYWSFSFSISSSSQYSGLFSFRMDWLDLLAVQGTLKSLIQHHSLKASIL